ncbi:FliH/SctL family protein [Parvibaculaceae bacterium PLY_AMNH_Bact1]|nr:FliH/SctL family protein [Parvibaculaceae bacterium PLY_AMNH_Bact1]
MTEAVKFTFNEMFDDDAGADEANAPQKIVRKSRWTDEEIEELKTEARAEGYGEALASVEAKSLEANSAALGKIATSASVALNELTRVKNEVQADAADLAFSVARKLADALLAAQPQKEIEAVIHECLKHLNREPRLVVRINDALVDDIQASMQQAAAERGMAEKMMVVGDAGIDLGDCEIEWSDGGVTRSRTDLEESAAKIINRYVETLTSGSETSANMETHNG